MYVLILEAVAFLIVPPAPSSIKNRSASAIAAPISVATIKINVSNRYWSSIVDADLFIIDDGAGGTNRKVTASRLKTYAQTGVSSAADDITEGDAAVTLSTSSGNITIDATAGDTDIIFKGTDNSSDITAATFDMSDGGALLLEGGLLILKIEVLYQILNFIVRVQMLTTHNYNQLHTQLIQEI